MEKPDSRRDPLINAWARKVAYGHVGLIFSSVCREFSVRRVWLRALHALPPPFVADTIEEREVREKPKAMRSRHAEADRRLLTA
jgi:hypothetical protein